MIVDTKPTPKAKESLSVEMRMTPQRWWAHTQDIFEDGTCVTSIELKSWFQLRANFEVDLNRYEVVHHWRSADRILKCDGVDVCRAKKRLLRRSFAIRHEESEFVFRPRSAFDRTFVLSEGDDDVGWVSPRGFFQNQLAARLPSRLPFEARVFVMWLVLSTMSSG